MKRVINLKLILALIFIANVFCSVFFAACTGKSDNTETGIEEQGESRKFTFAEYAGIISNPGIGYTTTDWYHTSVGNTQPHDSQGDIVLFFIDLSPFSAGANSDGIDYDLDEQFFTALRSTFENCKNNGSTFAVRFRYDENGIDNPEPNSFEQVLKHISQIKESGVLEEYKDILMFVESGFVGKWGEQHGGKYTTVEYKARLLAAMLDCVPAPIPVTVRTPDVFAKYVGIDRSQLADYVAEEGSDAARVGLYDDGYMGSDADLGTYANRETETQWLGNQTLTSYFGGEFSGDINFAKQYDTYLPENCIPEMYKTHLSYINSNIFQLYKDYQFTAKYDVEGFDNSAYYGQSVYQFIRDHLGYRFVLKESVFPKSVAQGGNLCFSFTVTNNGFANPVKEQKCEIILEKDGRFITTEVDADPTKWYSGETVTCELNLKLPAITEAGEWNVYFKSSVGVDGFSQYGFRSIRFASKDVWQETIGANYIGCVEITEAADNVCDNTFGEAGKALTQAHLYCLSGKVTVDGEFSEGEWTAQDIIAESEQYKLYAKADEENLYIMADIPHNSAAPVFNFRATDESGTTYWIYQQSNGFIYFNHDADTGHSGMVMKYSDNLFEFKIPFYMLGLENRTTLSGMSVSVQDSADGWKGTGSITGASYTVKSDFRLFNAYESVYLEMGGTYETALVADADITEVLWYLDGVEIMCENTAHIKLENVNSDCKLSAKITSVNGTVKEIEIADIKIR